jgi:hypothetical protein
MPEPTAPVPRLSRPRRKIGHLLTEPSTLPEIRQRGRFLYEVFVRGEWIGTRMTHSGAVRLVEAARATQSALFMAAQKETERERLEDLKCQCDAGYCHVVETEGKVNMPGCRNFLNSRSYYFGKHGWVK